MKNKAGYPFEQGLPVKVVLRLLHADFTKADYKLYLQTSHWKNMRKEVFAIQGSQCRMCGTRKNLQVHHTPAAYKRLFREDPKRDLSPTCKRCHRKNH